MASSESGRSSSIVPFLLPRQSLKAQDARIPLERPLMMIFGLCCISIITEFSRIPGHAVLQQIDVFIWHWKIPHIVHLVVLLLCHDSRRIR